MLILPKEELVKRHEDAKAGLVNHFNSEMEKILNANGSKDKYWILGKVRFPSGKNVAKVFLQACDEKPGLVKESFVYEVDNRRGVKTLLWVLHPGDMLRLPTLNKTISL